MKVIVKIFLYIFGISCILIAFFCGVLAMIALFGSIETVIEYWSKSAETDPKIKSINNLTLYGFFYSTVLCAILGYVGTKIMNKVLDEGDNFK